MVFSFPLRLCPAGVALALGLALAPAANAQSREVEGVVVEGRAAPLEARVHAYVRAAAKKEFGESLVRWRRAVCPLVAGLPKDQGEYVLSRLSQVAAQARAPLGDADCKPNVYIVVTHDPKALLTAWKKRDSNLFGHELPPRIARFIATDRPIRVWHNWAFEHWADADLGDLAKRRRQQPEGLNPNEGRLENSRIVSSVVRNDWGAVVVVDAEKTRALSVGQLADYVAMTTLCEFDLDAPLGEAPTILRLFQSTGADRPQSLSDWDLALLKAVYSTEQQLKNQPSVIASRMLKDLPR